MTQQEVEKFETELTRRFGAIIKTAAGYDGIIQVKPKNDDNITMKLRSKVGEINGQLTVTNILLITIAQELKDLRVSSGLSLKPNSSVIVSEFKLTPVIFDPASLRTERGVMVSYRYEYDKDVKKTKIDPLDRY